MESPLDRLSSAPWMISFGAFLRQTARSGNPVLERPQGNWSTAVSCRLMCEASFAAKCLDQRGPKYDARRDPSSHAPAQSDRAYQ